MFCKYCGHLVPKEDGGNAVADTSGRTPANAPQGSGKYLIPILCVAAVLIFIIAGKMLVRKPADDGAVAGGTVKEETVAEDGFPAFEDAVKAHI